jgi:hypothetical protein
MEGCKPGKKEETATKKQKKV